MNKLHGIEVGSVPPATVLTKVLVAMVGPHPLAYGFQTRLGINPLPESYE